MGKCVFHNGRFYLWGKCVIHNGLFYLWGKRVIQWQILLTGMVLLMGQMCNS